MENISKFNTTSFKTPSGFEVTIREQNGDDDDIISRMKDSLDGTAINNFISSIVVSSSIKPGGKLTPDDVINLKNRDKYYILLKSRIFSLGSEITYKHKCSNVTCGKETEYEEDLKPYDFDFSKPDEKPSGFKYQILPYKNGQSPEAEIKLSSGKKIRYTYLNGIGDKKLLELNKDDISKNTELLVRSIQCEINGKWQQLENFKFLTAREMSEIRKHVADNDTQFEAISEVICPFCKNIDHISLLTEPTFFFPLEIS
jgi:hypothetical protein